MSLPKPQKSVTDNFKSLELESAESFPSPALLRVRQRIENGCDSPSIKLPPSPTLSKLGFGTGVSVYLLKRPPKLGLSRSPWAVKKINKYGMQSKDMYNQRLKTEAQILKEMNHPNLVSFRHQYNDGSLALEAAECSLSDLIDKLTETNITIESVLFPACDISNMIKDCNNGLLYLHESVAIMHGDLKR